MISSGTSASRPVRPPSFGNYSNTLNHSVPSSVPSYYSNVMQSVPSGSFTFRQQQQQQYLQSQPLTSPAMTTAASSSYTIDALATAATSQISAERYHENTPSTLASPLFGQPYNNTHQADLHGSVQITGSSNNSVPAAAVAGMAAAYTTPLPPPHPPVPQSQHSQHSQQSQQSQSSSYSGNSHHSQYSPSVADMQYRMETLNPHNDEAAVVSGEVKQMQVCMDES